MYTKVTTLATTTAPNSTAEIPCGESGVVAVSIKGTFVGTLQFEATIDGVNYYAQGGALAGAVAGVANTSSVAVVGDWFVPVAAAVSFRVRFSAYTSGGAVVTLRADSSSIPLNWSNGSNIATPSAVIGGFTTYHSLVSAATTNATSVKASAGTIGGIVLTNASAAVKFFKLYNKASAPTVGTDTPIAIVGIPAHQTVTWNCEQGLRLTTGIAYALTGLMPVADTTAVALNDVAVHINYI